MGWFLFGHIAILHNKGTTQIQVETRNTHHRREFFRVQFLGFLWGTLPLIMISVTYLVSSLSHFCPSITGHQQKGERKIKCRVPEKLFLNCDDK
jgi:hypothetical protein